MASIVAVAEKQKFFGSFFQKRTRLACLLPGLGRAPIFVCDV
jgi:hypothetical protein